MSGNGAAYIGSSNTPANGVKWSRIYTTDYKPTAQDTGALPITGGTLTGQLSINHADFINKNGYTTYTDGDGKLHRQAGGLRLTIADTILTELYYNETAGISAEVSLHNKYGSTDSYISLRNDGQLSVIGTSPQVILSNGTIFATDGNVKGSVWDNGYLSNWILSKANAAKDAAIDWANTNCARKPTSWLQPTGWFRDATTGLITQWGIVTRGGDSTRVWFPSAFPNACVNVQLTLRNSNSGGSSSNVFANSEDGQGFNYISGSNEVQSFWLAKGY
ncbi:gp53-like domain-containing protein [Serratia proteamaculans]|uniref:gp53-like domain-containing protein n=1 Tax=Serratia proteamaculans TaxID=28151 RepID=UPI003964791D